MPHTDPDLRRAYHRDYKRRNRWRYRRRQKASDAARNANRRAKGFGVLGRLTADEVEAVLATGRCHWCGDEFGFFDLTVDHVRPLGRGGLNRPENLVAACNPCNKRKHTGQHPERWANDWDACIDCGRTTVKHAAHGRCRTCYWRRNKEADQ